MASKFLVSKSLVIFNNRYFRRSKMSNFNNEPQFWQKDLINKVKEKYSE